MIQLFEAAGDNTVSVKTCLDPKTEDSIDLQASL